MPRKLLIAGKGFIAVWALEHALDVLSLMQLDFSVMVLPVRGDEAKDTWHPSLKKRAAELSVPIVERLAEANLDEPDVLVSLEFDQIIKAADLHGARAYNLHFSLLPQYRGCHTSVWPIRLGEQRTGVTLHEIYPGIDDGPIVDQVAFEVPPFVTSFDLYLLYNEWAMQLFKANVQRLLTADVVAAREQDDDLASYFSRGSIDYRHTVIDDFGRPASEVRDWVRSLIFPPYQLPTWNGLPVRSCDDVGVARRSEDQPGDVALQDAGRAIIACADGYVRLRIDADNAQPRSSSCNIRSLITPAPTPEGPDHGGGGMPDHRAPKNQ